MFTGKVLKRVCVLVLIIFMTSVTMNLSAEETGDLQTGRDGYITTCAETIKQKMEVQAENTSIVSVENLERNYHSTLQYNMIKRHIEEKEDELRNHYAGAYINADDYLVVMLACDSGECKRIIETEIGLKNIVYEKGQKSWVEEHQKLDMINEKIAALYTSVMQGTAVSEDAGTLVQSRLRTEFDYHSNDVSIIFYLSEETRKTLTEQYLCSTEEEQFDVLTKLFAEIIGNYDDVKYVLGEGSGIDADDCSTAWRPGRALFVQHGLVMAPYSSGYRAVYSVYNLTYNGYVTAAHNLSIGDSVYIDQTASTANKIGVIIDRVETGRLDVAFINFTNPNFTTGSNAVYYTSSQPGVTTQGTVLDGTIIDVVTNSYFYKSGQGSYLTIGQVGSIDEAYTSPNGFYFFDLFRANTNMTVDGDSGGIAYVISNAGATSGKAVGIVKGHHNYLSTFVKARNIRDYFYSSSY